MGSAARKHRSGVGITLHGIVVYVHDGPPTEAGFGEFLRFCREHRRRIQGYLVLARGGMPSAKQRGMAAEEHSAFEPRRTAILTDHVIGPGIATALDWNRGEAWYQAFEMSRWDEARRYLEMSPWAFRDVVELARRLAGELEMRVPWPSA